MNGEGLEQGRGVGHQLFGDLCELCIAHSFEIALESSDQHVFYYIAFQWDEF